MGYFQRKRSRSRCAAQKSAASWRQPAPGLAEWLHSASAASPETFIRLATHERDWRSHRPRGIFRVAGRLEDRIALSRSDRRDLRDCLKWFNSNLVVPPWSSVDAQAIFWFRSSAGECLTRLATLVRLLEANGVPVGQLTAVRPGRVVYQDDQQVAAIPFADARYEAFPSCDKGWLGSRV